VHSNNELAQDVRSELEFVRERLHIIDNKGKLFVGIEAFIILWENSPKERWKSKLFSFPVIKPLANLAYNGFAHLLYKWNRKRGNW